MPVRVKAPLRTRAAKSDTIGRILTFRAIMTRRLCRKTTPIVPDLPIKSGTVNAIPTITTRTVAGTGVSSCRLDGRIDNGPITKALFSLLYGFEECG